MIVGFTCMFIVIGMILMLIDVFIPLYMPLPYLITLKIMGLGISAIGIMILGGRIYQTGVGPFLEIPNTRRVILLHQRRGQNPNARFIPAKLEDLEYLRAKNKIFKDTGGGFRVSGHDVRRTHEMISFDIPEWLSQYFYQIKNDFGVNGSVQFKTLRTALKDIKPPLQGVMTLEDQLNRIELLKPIMEDDTRKQVLLNMDYRQLQNLDQLLFDGVTHHGEEVESFIESATPNELGVLEKQKFLNEKMEEKNYREVGEHNIGQWIGPVIMLLVGGAIAVAIIAGVFQ